MDGTGSAGGGWLLPNGTRLVAVCLFVLAVLVVLVVLVVVVVLWQLL